MALLSTRSGIKQSGWALVVGDETDWAAFEKEELEAMRAGAEQRMDAATDLYLTEVKRALRRSLPQGEHAAKNDPPAKIIGDLQRSWKRGRRSWTRDKTILTGRIQSRHPAAGLFEYIGPAGTARLGIQPHPYVRPTLLRIADRLHDLLLGL